MNHPAVALPEINLRHDTTIVAGTRHRELKERFMPTIFAPQVGKGISLKFKARRRDFEGRHGWLPFDMGEFPMLQVQMVPKTIKEPTPTFRRPINDATKNLLARVSLCEVQVDPTRTGDNGVQALNHEDMPSARLDRQIANTDVLETLAIGCGKSDAEDVRMRVLDLGGIWSISFDDRPSWQVEGFRRYRCTCRQSEFSSVVRPSILYCPEGQLPSPCVV